MEFDSAGERYWGQLTMIKITQIEISNFRSIRRLVLGCDAFTVLVGYNDSGKSNVLRALNLFFNGETNPGKQLNFSEDYNFFAPVRRQRAKEIIVRLELDIPVSYRALNGDILVWERRWRAAGRVSDTYAGYRIKKNRRGHSVREHVRIPARSNLHSLLTKVEFNYVPAVKDSEFFDGLRGGIYKIISEVAAEKFRQSSSSFEKSIAEQLNDLTNDISKSLSFDTKLALPRDLSHVFERLDFLSGAKSVSLESRGDGIKARHIPLILKFMADKKRSLQVRGSMPSTFIWGYEEPENNLELTSAIALADEFKGYAANETAQILLTTHSPVFYNAAKQGDGARAISQHVFKISDDEGTQAKANAADLDAQMGTMALFAPMVAEVEDRVRKIEVAKAEASAIEEKSLRPIFVEGTSDKIFLDKLILEFAPSLASKIAVRTKGSGAGHNYVTDMLMGWHAAKKHDQTRPRAAGVVDHGDDSSKNAKQWNEVDGHTASCKCFKIPAPPHLHALLSQGFNLPPCLEDLYPLDMWQWADARGYLEARPLVDILPSAISEEILSGTKKLGDVIPATHELIVKNRVSAFKKVPLAKHVAGLDSAKFSADFSYLTAFVKQLTDYLFSSAG